MCPNVAYVTPIGKSAPYKPLERETILQEYNIEDYYLMATICSE